MVNILSPHPVVILLVSKTYSEHTIELCCLLSQISKKNNDFGKFLAPEANLETVSGVSFPVQVSASSNNVAILAPTEYVPAHSKNVPITVVKKHREDCWQQ